MRWEILLLVVCTMELVSTQIIKSNREFYDLFIIKPEDASETSEASLSRALNGLSMRAFCENPVIPVAVPKHSDPVLLYSPSFVYLHRCMGACAWSSMSCNPIIDPVPIKLMVLIPNGGKFSVVTQEEIQMDNHTDCMCGCLQMPEDCNSLQRYVNSKCECVCKEAKVCGEGKVWDKKECVCKCRTVITCETYDVFDPESCTCTKHPGLGGTDQHPEHFSFDRICPDIFCPGPQIVDFAPDPCVCKFP